MRGSVPAALRGHRARSIVRTATDSGKANGKTAGSCVGATSMPERGSKGQSHIRRSMRINVPPMGLTVIQM
jgi:hypothetical protein